jgi:uncharacterized protein
MTRLIIIVIVVAAALWLLRRAITGPGPRQPKSGAQPGESGEQKGDLVSCAQCGVNLPKGEAYAARGVLPSAAERFYCSEEHSRLDPRDG